MQLRALAVAGLCLSLHAGVAVAQIARADGTAVSCGTEYVKGDATCGNPAGGSLPSGGTVQSCTITFVPAFTTAPACTCTNETNILLVRGTTTTTTTLVCDAAVAGTMESDVISYVCLGGS